jgi:hypothetical protein
LFVATRPPITWVYLKEIPRMVNLNLFKKTLPLQKWFASTLNKNEVNYA